MLVSMIAAIGKNRELGWNNQLLWHLSEDLKNFKKITLNRHLLMGRHTYESIGKPLPKRTTIVLTRQLARDADYPEGVLTAASIEAGIELAQSRGESELVIVGGGEIYKQSLSLTKRLYLTEVDFTGRADTFFPSLQTASWHVIDRSKFAATHQDPAWTFTIMERKD